jgi:hypothetical protein
LRRHAQLLSAAGIAVLIFDTTNNVTYPEVYRALCAVFEDVRRAGGRAQGIAFMVNTRAGETADQIYRDLYRPGRFRDLWFLWEGKPLMICDPEAAGPELRRFFTLRRAHWPFTQVDTPYAWHWEATYAQHYGYTTDPGRPEQLNVSAAQNLRVGDGKVTNMSAGNARGRSFHDGSVDRSPGAVDRGLNVQEQWHRVRTLDPPFVMVTGWNEWIAGRWGEPGGPVEFVDQLNQEYSRDIEPMKGGHGDSYDYQLVANVRRYKGAEPLPRASASRSIRIDGGMDQWADVLPAFTDDSGDTAPRDFDGAGGLHYRDRSGRNDLVQLKVARDDTNVYFYARTRQALTPRSDLNWMWLLIDIDGNPKTGWEGYDFIVNRRIDGRRHRLAGEERRGLALEVRREGFLSRRRRRVAPDYPARIARDSARSGGPLVRFQVGRQPPATGRCDGLLHQRGRGPRGAIPVSLRRLQGGRQRRDTRGRDGLSMTRGWHDGGYAEVIATLRATGAR